MNSSVFQVSICTLLLLCSAVYSKSLKSSKFRVVDDSSVEDGSYSWLNDLAAMPIKQQNKSHSKALQAKKERFNWTTVSIWNKDDQSSSSITTISTTTEARRSRKLARTTVTSRFKDIHPPALPKVSETFQEYVDKIKSFIDELMKLILPKILDLMDDIDISGDCMKSAFNLFMAFRELKPWAVNMVDALGKPPAGIFRGTGTAMGDYDQCVNIVAAEESGSEGQMHEMFRGKYCLVRLIPPELLSFYPQHWEREYRRTILPDIIKSDTIFRSFAEYFPRFGNTSHFKFGLCIPSTCTEKDILGFMGAFARLLEHTVQVEHCSVKQASHWSAEQIVIFTFLVALILFIFICTLVDIFIVRRKKVKIGVQGKIVCVVSEFSAIRNTKKLANTDVPEDDLTYIRGLRLISIIWVVVAHVFYFPELDYYYQLQSLLTLVELNKISIFHMMSNSSFSVDTFFVASAILTAYTIGRRKAKGQSPKYFRYFARRVLRILPAELFLIAIFLLIPLCGDGPLWKNLVLKSVDGCRATWWRNLLFIQNLWWDDKQCLFHLWFLSCLVQYSLIGLPIVALLLKKPMKGTVVCFCAMLAAAIAIGITTFRNRFGPGISATNFYFTYLWKQIFKNYMSPWAHLGPYCVGLVVGTVLVTQPKLKFKTWQLIVGWVGSVAVGSAVVCGLYNFVYPPQTYIIVSSIYNALSRNVWAIALSWLCIVCGRGQGGLVDRLLSWKVLIPFDRLAFFMYLTHLPIMYYFRGRARALSFAGLPDMTVTALGLLTLTIMMSYVCYVLVEAPVQVIDSFLFPKSEEKVKISEPVVVVEFRKKEESCTVNGFRKDSSDMATSSSHKESQNVS